MHIRTLRAFVEVVQQGGFSQAARVVCATQSSVSKSVKTLEDKLGFPLFERGSQRCRLTSAGEIAYRRARSILAERDGLLAELRAMPDLKHGTLRLGLPPAASAIRFAPLFAAYRKRYPGIDIQLVEHGCLRLAEMLAAGELDIAALLAPLAPAFDSQVAGSVEPFMVIMADNHPLAHGKSVGLEQLGQFPFILYEAGFAINPLILEACRRCGFEPTIAARSGQIDFIAELVAAGLGIAFLPATMADRYGHSGIHQALVSGANLELRLDLAWRCGQELVPAAHAWLRLARELCGDKISAPA